MKVKHDKPGKGWFENHDFVNRSAGLHFGDITGKSVLDLGCAEGKISEWLVDRGAQFARGFDYNMTRVAQKMNSDVFLEYADLNYPGQLPYREDDQFDIVLVLAILQHLKQPRKLLDYALARCRWKIAVRVPFFEAKIDARPHDVKELCEVLNFKFESQTIVLNDLNPLEHVQNKSWIGIFARDGD